MEGVCYFKLEVDKDLHNELINFLAELNFPEEETTKVDAYFPEIDEEYIYVREDKFKIHFFVTKGFVHMVIDCPIKKQELHSLMKKYFVFPR